MMEAWELKREYEKRHPNGHFFDHDTLKFFGERLSEMRVLKSKANVDGHECYILSSLQRKYPDGHVGYGTTLIRKPLMTL